MAPIVVTCICIAPEVDTDFAVCKMSIINGFGLSEVNYGKKGYIYFELTKLIKISAHQIR